MHPAALIIKNLVNFVYFFRRFQAFTTGTDRSPSRPLRNAPCYLQAHVGLQECQMCSVGKESAMELSQWSLESNILFSLFQSFL